MTTLHSPSTASESTMEEEEEPSSSHRRQNTPNKPQHASNTTTVSTTTTTTTGDSDSEVVQIEDGGDPEVWAAFNESFRQVQSMLDRNRILIQQVNENQQSRLPDNMVKNVTLIQELNGNISKVVSLYSDLNSNFSNACEQHSKNSSGNTLGK